MTSFELVERLSAAALLLASACSDGAAAVGNGAGGAATSSGGSTAAGGSSGAAGTTQEGHGGGASGSGGAASPGSGGSDAGMGETESDSGSATSGLAAVLSRSVYEALLPNRNALYDYDSLLGAAAKYPGFASTGTLEQRRRELAAFLANIAHETTGGWPTAPGGPEAWGLYFKEEVGCEAGACTQYCDSSNVDYPCAPGKTYHGRGPIQLSWNYNYGAFGAVLGVDLLGNPDLVTSDGALAFETALWFWMTTQAPKPSAHDALLGIWQPSDGDTSLGRAPGFGMTVNIINGGLECGRPTDARVEDRIRFFRHFAATLATTEGDNLECAAMSPY
jgi:basic endochitinase B